MHDYLRAVGFSKVQHKRDLQRLLDMVMGSPDSEFASSCGGGLPYAESAVILYQMPGLRYAVK